MYFHISLFTTDQHGMLQAECLRFPALNFGESRGTWMLVGGGGFGGVVSTWRGMSCVGMLCSVVFSGERVGVILLVMWLWMHIHENE